MRELEIPKMNIMIYSNPKMYNKMRYKTILLIQNKNIEEYESFFNK